MLTAATLTAAELAEITGKRRSDAQARVLDFMGIAYATRPNGTLAVLREVMERRLGGAGTIQPREPQLQP